MNISSSLWQEWAKILNDDKSKKEKIKEYIKVFQSLELNKDDIIKIIKDDHLIEFYSSGYNGIYNRIDDLFRLYNNRLNAEQITEIIHLKLNTSHLASNMNFFQSLNFIIKEYHVPIDDSYINDFLENAKKTIPIMSKLIAII